MFSGINPEGRNSSKVLRPPGGGSSLGPFSCEEPEEVTRAPVTAPAPVEKEQVGAPQVQEPEPAAIVETSAAESSPPVEPEPVTNSAPEPEVAPAPAAPLAGVRGRVPPGGHSSGPFW